MVRSGKQIGDKLVLDEFPTTPTVVRAIFDKFVVTCGVLDRMIRYGVRWSNAR